MGTTIGVQRSIVTWQKRAVAPGTMRQSDLIAHAVHAGHLPGQRGGALQIALGAGRHLVVDRVFGGAASGEVDTVCFA